MIDNQFDKGYYFFPREHTGTAPERTPPVKGWGQRLLGIAVGMLLGAGIIMLVL
jgi:hypothetical protein